MRNEWFPPWRRRRLTLAVLAVAYLAVWRVVAAPTQTEPAQQQPAGSFEIPAWTFDGGKARVDANRDLYADYRDTYPELVAGGGGQLPWMVEYDVGLPVDTTYTLHVRYASPQSRPLPWAGKKAAMTTKVAVSLRETPLHLTSAR